MAVNQSSSLQPPPYKRPFLRWSVIKENITGYIFILPAVLIILMFGIFPIGYALYMSLYTWRVKKGPFIGLDNYTKALGDWQGVGILVAGFILLWIAYWLWTTGFRSGNLKTLVIRAGSALILVASFYAISVGWSAMTVTGDKNFLRSLPITLFYAIGTVPAELGIALVLAYLLFQRIRGKEFFRMLYFLPYVTPVVATAVVFRTIFGSNKISIANQVLNLIGMAPKKWLFESAPFNQAFFGINVSKWPDLFAGPSMALVSIIFFGIWTFVGYNTVIFLAGLGSISPELYEAGEIDGANKFQLFTSITLPLLSPVTFYLALIAFIGTFKAFNHIYVMRTPSALGTTDVTSIFIFDTFYKSNNFGYATAQAVILFFIILALTAVQNKVFGEKVFYD